MKVAVELDKRVTNPVIFCIDIGKFSNKEKPSPIILFKIDKSLEISFHSTVLPLCLAINL